jgi:hypothetical protein
MAKDTKQATSSQPIKCNASGKACSKCHTLNHFASVYRQGLTGPPPERTNINSINYDHQTSKNGKIEVNAAEYAENARYKQAHEYKLQLNFTLIISFL